MAPGFVITVQASVVLGPAAFASSVARTMSAETPGEVRAPPKTAAPTSYWPAMAAGALIPSRGSPNASRDGTAAVTSDPIQTTLRPFGIDRRRSATVIAGQVLPMVLSKRLRLYTSGNPPRS